MKHRAALDVRRRAVRYNEGGMETRMESKALNTTENGSAPATAKRIRFARLRLPDSFARSGWRQYALGLLIVVLVGAFYVVLHNTIPWFGYQAIGLIELFAVLLIAIYLGRGPALLAAFFSALAWNYLFITPRFTFAVTHAADLVLLVLYFVIALSAGSLAARLREEERAARHNAERTLALYTLAIETSTATNLSDVLATAVAQIQRVFAADVAILLAHNDTLARRAHPVSTLEVGSEDFAAARWAFEKSQHAGQFTKIYPADSARFVPLRTPTRAVGVLGLQLHWVDPPTFEQSVFLETFASQIALAIEREMLAETTRQNLMLRESERLYGTLLNSISHELRTPLATVTGAASSLLEPYSVQDPAVRRELVRDIQSAAGRLNRLVENLLDMSRLDSGRLQLRRDWCDVGEVIGVALQSSASLLEGRSVRIQIAPDLPLVQMDFSLIEQVLVNLLDNACAYTVPDTPIEVDARLEKRATGDCLQIMVADAGPGVPPEQLDRIFDKFYRVSGTAVGGTGLGLSICKGLVEAHGGTLSAANRAAGGLKVTITLPAATFHPPVPEAFL
jgi:two-component system sensor histidine kinase KdpD